MAVYRTKTWTMGAATTNRWSFEPSPAKFLFSNLALVGKMPRNCNMQSIYTELCYERSKLLGRDRLLLICLSTCLLVYYTNQLHLSRPTLSDCSKMALNL